MKLRDYVIRRLLLLIPVFLGVSLITFALTRAVGDPASIYISDKCDDQCAAAIREKYGFDQPVPVQYAKYMWGMLVEGDLGYSRIATRPVALAISEKFMATAELATATMILSVVVGIPLGVISATRRNKAIDHVTRVFALSGVSVPVFWLGLMLKITFYFGTIGLLGYSLLPVTGRYSTSPVVMYGPPLGGFPVEARTGFYTLDAILGGSLDGLLDALSHLILPTVTLTFVTMALITRMMRSSMLEVMGQEYIKTARSKGLSEKVVIDKHARRNALIPTTTVIGLSFGGLLGGAVLTEYVFDWPGLGQWTAAAVPGLDSAAIMGFTLLAAVVYVVANLIVDILYAILDPRIRLGE